MDNFSGKLWNYQVGIVLDDLIPASLLRIFHLILVSLLQCYILIKERTLAFFAPTG